MSIFNSIAQLLLGGEDLVAAVIVASSGSTPRAAGARMVIRGDGAIVGTIGGGVLEARVRELAREVFSRRTSLLREFVLTDEDSGRIGMICGGRALVLLHFIDGSQPSNSDLYREIAERIESRKRSWLITGVPSGDNDSGPTQQHLSGDDGSRTGPLDSGVVQTLTAPAGAGGPRLVQHQGKRFFVESILPPGTVYIFGAGHIGLVLARLTRLVGFQTIVLDDRNEFANRERFESADKIIVPGSFEQALDGLDIDEDSYLVLVTRGHAHDKTVLGQALRTRAGYIGMIGSRRKRDAVYEALCGEGFSRREFERVCSPIGLDIGAETPEEIAVSIVAELIRARAHRNR